jgi:hypothetical protein
MSRRTPRSPSQALRSSPVNYLDTLVRMLRGRSLDRESAAARLPRVVKRLTESPLLAVWGDLSTNTDPIGRVRNAQDLGQRFPRPLFCWKGTSNPVIANSQVNECFRGGRGTRTHKPFRATVFKCVAGRPDWPCLLLPDAICAGQRQDNFLTGTNRRQSFLTRPLTKR